MLDLEGTISRVQQFIPELQQGFQDLSSSGIDLQSILGLGIALLFFSLIIVLALYVYMSLALYTIAKKTDTPDEWMAWVPYVNLFLMARIGGVSYGFAIASILTSLAILSLSFVPFLGPLLWLANLAIGTFLLWKIAEARKMPGWLALIQLIPLVGLAAWGIIAWKD